MSPLISKSEAASLKISSLKAKNTGAVVYVDACDVAYEMIRQPVKELLGQPVAEFAVDAGKRSPRPRMFYRLQGARLPSVDRIGTYGPVRVLILETTIDFVLLVVGLKHH